MDSNEESSASVGSVTTNNCLSLLNVFVLFNTIYSFLLQVSEAALSHKEFGSSRSKSK